MRPGFVTGLGLPSPTVLGVSHNPLPCSEPLKPKTYEMVKPQSVFNLEYERENKSTTRLYVTGV